MPSITRRGVRSLDHGPLNTAAAPEPVSIPDVSALSVGDAAVAYARARLRVLPVRAGTKNPGSLLGGSWHTQSSADPEVVAEWFERWPNANVGIHLGASGLVAFDLDRADDLSELPDDIAEALRLGAFHRSRTGARGHYVFADDVGTSNSPGGFAAWGDVRGKNGFIMAAPSIHPETGKPYQWVSHGAVAPLPATLRALVGVTRVDVAEAMTPAGLSGFLRDHTTATSPDKVDLVVRAFRRRVDSGEARHTAMQGTLVAASRDARAGLYSAETAMERLRGEYELAFADPKPDARSHPTRGEFEGMALWAAAQRTPAESADRLWTMSPQLKLIRRWAQEGTASPFAVLGEGLLRALLAAPPSYYLPPLAGTYAPVNLFLAVVGPSGSGKGISRGIADDLFVYADPITEEDIRSGTPGSGEGIAAMYGRWVAKEKRVVHFHSRVYAVFAEVDQMASMFQRTGSSLDSLLREGWSGGRLGNTTNDATRTNELGTGRYRLVMSVGVQPERGGVLLEGAAGGTPQRFLWAMATDSTIPDPTGDRSDLAPIRLPLWEFNREAWLERMARVVDPGERVMFSVPERVKKLVWVSRKAALRGHVESIDGHRLLLMEKIALGFAIIHGKTDGFTEQHWEMAERLMLHSDTALASVRAALAEAAAAAAEAKSRAEGRGATIREEAAEHELRARCRERCLTLLRDATDEWVAGAVLRRKLSAAQKGVADEVLADLVSEGLAKRQAVKTNGSEGYRYRVMVKS